MSRDDLHPCPEGSYRIWISSRAMLRFPPGLDNPMYIWVEARGRTGGGDGGLLGDVEFIPLEEVEEDEVEVALKSSIGKYSTRST